MDRRKKKLTLGGMPRTTRREGWRREGKKKGWSEFSTFANLFNNEAREV